MPDLIPEEYGVFDRHPEEVELLDPGSRPATLGLAGMMYCDTVCFAGMT